MESTQGLEFAERENTIDQLRENKRKANAAERELNCFYATDIPLPEMKSPHEVIERTLEFTTSGTDEVTLYDGVYSSLLSLRIVRIKTSGFTVVGSRTVTAAYFSNRIETLPKCESLTTEYRLEAGEYENLLLLEQGKLRETLFALRCGLTPETLAQGTIKRDDGWTLVPANHLIIDRLKRRYPLDTFAKQVYYAFSPDMFALVLKDDELQDLCTDGNYSDGCHMTVVADGTTTMTVYVRFLSYKEGEHPRVCY